jgi:hypothetical protein
MHVSYFCFAASNKQIKINNVAVYGKPDAQI